MKTHEKDAYVRPFLRWVGGKQRLVACLKAFMPDQKPKRYFEPFVGGGSLFFAHGFAHAELSDLNPHLVNAYHIVRDNPEAIHIHLAKHAVELEAGGKDYYLKQRNLFNEQDLKKRYLIEQAARFIFLIHSNFNGMYRVNSKGQYNIPFGSTDKPSFPSLDHLQAASRRLQGVSILHQGYEKIIDDLKQGDLVYLDPPYPVLSPTANFSGYTMERFSEIEQRTLAENAQKMVQKGAKVMISITKVPLIGELYPIEKWEYCMTRLKRNVSAKRPALIVEELILISKP